jgi:hypothetical protein
LEVEIQARNLNWYQPTPIAMLGSLGIQNWILTPIPIGIALACAPSSTIRTHTPQLSVELPHARDKRKKAHPTEKPDFRRHLPLRGREVISTAAKLHHHLLLL